MLSKPSDLKSYSLSKSDLKSQNPTSAWSELQDFARTLRASQAKSLERELVDSDSDAIRVVLLIFYSQKKHKDPYKADFARHMDWFIQRYPKSWITYTENMYYDADRYFKTLERSWATQLRRHPHDAELINLAAKFSTIVDEKNSEKLWKRGQKLSGSIESTYQLMSHYVIWEQTEKSKAGKRDFARKAVMQEQILLTQPYRYPGKDGRYWYLAPFMYQKDAIACGELALKYNLFPEAIELADQMMRAEQKLFRKKCASSLRHHAIVLKGLAYSGLKQYAEAAKCLKKLCQVRERVIVFKPNMSLAAELLSAGHSAAVFDYIQFLIDTTSYVLSNNLYAAQGTEKSQHNFQIVSQNLEELKSWLSDAKLARNSSKSIRKLPNFSDRTWW